MGCQEITLVEGVGCYILHQQEETSMLQMQISVEVYEGEVADLSHRVSILLYGKLIKG